jgi:hypothetical protein
MGLGSEHLIGQHIIFLAPDYAFVRPGRCSSDPHEGAVVVRSRGQGARAAAERASGMSTRILSVLSPY